MRVKHIGIPVGMVFLKFHCSNCGTKLTKEKNHRIVSKDDVDYFSYQDRTSYPRLDRDVFDYHFKCSKYQNRYSYQYQCIINRIQKAKHQKILSKKEIKESYSYFKNKQRIYELIREIIMGLIVSLLCAGIYYLFEHDLTVSIIMFFVTLGLTYFFTIRNYIYYDERKRNRFRKEDINYSYEEKFLANYYYSLRFNNRKDVEESEYCYRYCCNEKLDSKLITEFYEDIHAICPKCNNQSILADTPENELNYYIIDIMNKYWF